MFSTKVFFAILSAAVVSIGTVSANSGDGKSFPHEVTYCTHQSINDGQPFSYLVQHRPRRVWRSEQRLWPRRCPLYWAIREWGALLQAYRCSLYVVPYIIVDLICVWLFFRLRQRQIRRCHRRGQVCWLWQLRYRFKPFRLFGLGRSEPRSHPRYVELRVSVRRLIEIACGSFRFRGYM